MGADPLWGRVVAAQANFQLVDLDDRQPGGLKRFLCTRRGRLTERLHVGDRVALETIDQKAGRAVIGAVAPRSNWLDRPPVANLHRVVVLVALAEPRLDAHQLSRFLLSAESVGPPVLLVFSKADLVGEQGIQEWCNRVDGWGYQAMAVSNRSGSGLEALRRRLRSPGISVLCGPSGVGKSSLINALRPELDLRTAAVSARLRRGRHTTRHVELFRLGEDAYVADTPGFNRPELPQDPVALQRLFPELRGHPALGACRYRNCRHDGDPGCAIGTDWDRSAFYRRCLADLREAPGSDPARRRSGRGRLRPPSPAG